VKRFSVGSRISRTNGSSLENLLCTGKSEVNATQSRQPRLPARLAKNGRPGEKARLLKKFDVANLLFVWDLELIPATSTPSSRT